MSQLFSKGTSSGMAGIGDFETDNAVVVTPDGSGTVTLTGGTTGLVLNGSANTVTLAGTLIVANGGTGTTTLTDGGILLGSGTAAVTVTAQPTDGQLLIGSTGVDPVLGTLASADGTVTITNGAGTIDLSAAPGIVWSVITDASKTVVVNEAYFANRAGTVAFTLPATSSVGDTFEIAQMMTGQVWTLAQNAGQTIYVGNTNTTTGVGGSLAATGDGDWIKCVCRVDDTDWQCKIESGNPNVT